MRNLHYASSSYLLSSLAIMFTHYGIRNEEMDTSVDAACQISEYVVIVS